MSDKRSYHYSLPTFWVALGVFWYVWGAKGFWWGVFYGLFWKFIAGYHLAAWLVTR